MRRINGQRLATGPRIFSDFAGQHGLHFVGGNFLVEAVGADRVGHPRRDIDAKVGTDQDVFQVFEGGRIQLALGDQVGDRAADRGGGALQPACEALPEGFGGVYRSSRCRDSGLVMTPKR